MPFLFFHPRIEGRQHANGPGTRFDPPPFGWDRSGLLSQRHCRRSVFRLSGHSTSIFLRPFAPPELPGFHATMDALTPERRLFGTRGLFGCSRMNTVLSIQVSLLHVLNLPVIPSPTTCCRPWSLVWFLSQAYRVVRSSDRPHPFGTTASWASPLPSRLATTTGRIEFVILRTNRSPPVALHPALRRRSYVRLQCSNPTLTGTCTPPIQHARKRTRSC